jgi:hypothetical protein
MCCREDTMANNPFILFNKSLQQLRLIGARGGKAYGRNQQRRRALMPPPSETIPLPTPSKQTTAEAIALLDAQFPWLRHSKQGRPSEASRRA